MQIIICIFQKLNVFLRQKATGIIRLLFCFNYGKMSPLLVQLRVGQMAILTESGYPNKKKGTVIA
ncbi:MAG: hypothetical protein BHV88_17635 [Clostridiales bacterium 41_12_two_minus]|nr:MAG: hypothetical protein BHV88_17635 [Clostridiales bacterium 41_12_two_minus]